MVEASNRSGALITARLAAEQNREVFAVPGDIFSEHSTGTHKLINQGAKLINTVDDLLNELPSHVLSDVQRSGSAPSEPSIENEDAQPLLPQQPAPEDTQRTPAPPPPPDLTPDEKIVFDAIEAPASHIDTIVRTTQLPIGQVSSVLLMLELKGAVEQLPGKQFAKASG